MNDDFHSWKHHPITQMVMEELKFRIMSLTDELVEQTPTSDPREMAYKVGAIKAYRDVLEIQPEEAQLGN